MNLPLATHTAPALTRDELELLLGLTRRLAAPFELSDMLTVVTDAASRLLHAERCSVWLLDAAQDMLVLRVASDLREVRIPTSQGLIGACARSRQLINVTDCYADPRFDRAMDLRSGFHTRCSLTLPLIDHEERLVGAMQLLNKAGGAFDAADEALALALAAQAAVALSRAALTEQAFAAQRMKQELALARLVQTSALPRELPQAPGYDMHASFRPEAETGGDSYDFARHGQRLRVLLADAAGHGIAPALAVTQLQAMLRASFRLGADLLAAFTQVNDLLAETLPDGHFITAFVGEIDLDSHRLHFVSGGQAPILVFRAATHAFDLHKATSFPMGAMPLQRPPRDVDTTLAPGDMLVLLSDGIYEFENARGQAYGRSRAEAVVAHHAAQGCAATAEALLADVQAFAEGAPQADDITVVLVQRQL